MRLTMAALAGSTFALAASLSGCGAPASPVASTRLVDHSSSHATTKPAPKVTKLLVLVEENHSLAEMKSGMPYLFSLAKRYGYANDYQAIRHPSLPNYLAITGGSTFGVTDDANPSDHRLTGRSVLGQALAQHETATLYAQGMPGPCATGNDRAYAVRHNPWAYFSHEVAQCRAHDVSMKRFAGDVRAGALPRVGMVIPDVDHDAHDGTLAVADDWLGGVMRTVFAGSDWKSGHLAIVITADEDDHSAGNHVLTVVIHPSQHHHVVSSPLTHYSLTRLYDEVAQLPLLRHAHGARSMGVAFGLPLP